MKVFLFGISVYIFSFLFITQVNAERCQTTSECMVINGGAGQRVCPGIRQEDGSCLIEDESSCAFYPAVECSSTISPSPLPTISSGSTPQPPASPPSEQQPNAVIAPGWRGTAIRSDVGSRALLPDEMNNPLTPTLAPGSPTPTLIPPVIGVDKGVLGDVRDKVVCTLLRSIPIIGGLFGSDYCPQLLVLSNNTQQFARNSQNLINTQRPGEIQPTIPVTDKELKDPDIPQGKMVNIVSSSLGTDQGLNSLDMPEELLKEIKCTKADDLISKFNLTADLANLIFGQKKFSNDCRVADEKTREKLFDQANFPEGINPFEPSPTP